MGMVDYNKIIKGLECCTPSNLECADCPYEDNGEGEIACRVRLMQETHDVLIMQQVEIERLANIIKNAQAGIEETIKLYCR